MKIKIIGAENPWAGDFFSGFQTRADITRVTVQVEKYWKIYSSPLIL